MLSRLAPIGLCIAGVINLLPVVGVLGASWLKSLYGFDIAGADLEILLRHRAVLFGIIGVLLLAAALRPALRGVAVILAFASMASFIVIALFVGGYGAPVTKIIIADIIGLIALVPAALARLSASSDKSG
jgi:hypothetical protein